MEDKYSQEEIKTLRIGAIALLAIIIITFITISHNASIKQDGLGDTYNIYADFGRTDGLNLGDVVRMSGVSIGRVVGASLDKNFNSRLTLEIDSKYKIPNDSSASIVSFGLIGGKYVEIDVGGAEEYFSSGQTISYTQDALVLEELLERIISMGKSKKATKENNDIIDNGGIDE
ncbi:MAG: MCE family protein [Alphaproteobacteria bacterium]|nr:MCE family protein [Alphaproteobacteria bacterium]